MSPRPPRKHQIVRTTVTSPKPSRVRRRRLDDRRSRVRAPTLRRHRTTLFARRGTPADPRRSAASPTIRPGQWPIRWAASSTIATSGRTTRRVAPAPAEVGRGGSASRAIPPSRPARRPCTGTHPRPRNSTTRHSTSPEAAHRPLLRAPDRPRSCTMAAPAQQDSEPAPRISPAAGGSRTHCPRSAVWVKPHTLRSAIPRPPGRTTKDRRGPRSRPVPVSVAPHAHDEITAHVAACPAGRSAPDAHTICSCTTRRCAPSSRVPCSLPASRC